MADYTDRELLLLTKGTVDDLSKRVDNLVGETKTAIRIAERAEVSTRDGLRDMAAKMREDALIHLRAHDLIDGKIEDSQSPFLMVLEGPEQARAIVRQHGEIWDWYVRVKPAFIFVGGLVTATCFGVIAALTAGIINQLW